MVGMKISIVKEDVIKIIRVKIIDRMVDKEDMMANRHKIMANRDTIMANRDKIMANKEDMINLNNLVPTKDIINKDTIIVNKDMIKEAMTKALVNKWVMIKDMLNKAGKINKQQFYMDLELNFKIVMYSNVHKM